MDEQHHESQSRGQAERQFLATLRTHHAAQRHLQTTRGAQEPNSIETLFKASAKPATVVTIIPARNPNAKPAKAMEAALENLHQQYEAKTAQLGITATDAKVIKTVHPLVEDHASRKFITQLTALYKKDTVSTFERKH